MQGKGAMVWQLRNWQVGDPVRQVEMAKAMGLTHVCLKVVDGDDERWEAPTVTRQNADLLPDTVAALQESGIVVSGWGWTYGFKVAYEAAATIRICAKHRMNIYLIDAEKDYDQLGMEDEAETLGRELSNAIPFVGLCSYRFPLTYQPKFPVQRFAPYMDFWAPQVYFLGDNRPTGGAQQLQASHVEHMKVRPLPFLPVAPTYPWGTWRASGAQLTAFFQKAKDLGCPGALIWCLEQASADQIRAVTQFVWGEGGTDPEVEIRKIVAEMRCLADRLEAVASQC
jgi:hypothetical protein